MPRLFLWVAPKSLLMAEEGDAPHFFLQPELTSQHPVGPIAWGWGRLVAPPFCILFPFVFLGKSNKPRERGCKIKNLFFHALVSINRNDPNGKGSHCFHTWAWTMKTCTGLYSMHKCVCLYSLLIGRWIAPANHGRHRKIIFHFSFLNEYGNYSHG